MKQVTFVHREVQKYICPDMKIDLYVWKCDIMTSRVVWCFFSDMEENI